MNTHKQNQTLGMHIITTYAQVIIFHVITIIYIMIMIIIIMIINIYNNNKIMKCKIADKKKWVHRSKTGCE
jgi:hypothetical protein